MSLIWYGSIRNLLLDYMVPKSLVLVCRTAFMMSPTICTFLISFFYLDSFYVNELHHAQHISDFSCSLVPCARNLGT